MMKNQIFRRLLYLLPVLFWPLISTAGNPIESSSSPSAPETICPAPPPPWITAPTITPTSVTLKWGSGNPGGAGQVLKFYKVEGHDDSDNVPLPTYYTTDTTFTYNNLGIGHDFTFSVSASYCPAGPQGQAISIEVTTGYIIVDIVLGLQSPCLPPPAKEPNTGKDVMFDFCVAQSSTDIEPYTNALVALLQVDNDDILQFGIAVVGTQAIFGPMDYNGNPYDPDFSFPWDPNAPPTDEATCYFMGEAAFTVKCLGSTYPQGPMSLRITFHGDFGGLTYCGDGTGCNGIGKPVAIGSSGNFTPVQIESLLSGSKAFGQTGNDLTPPKAALRSSDITLINQPNPNPFSRSVALTYSIEEAGPVVISLCDAMGRLVRTVEHTATQPAGQYDISIDGTGLPDGVYFLHVLTGENRKVFALVKRE